MRLLLAFVVACSFGCDSSTKTPADGGAARDAALGDAGQGELVGVARGGSRLQAIWGGPEDGEPVFLGFFDRERNVRCRFVLATDGRYRCLPDAGNAATIYFDDEACRTPRLWWRDDPNENVCVDAPLDAGTGMTPPPGHVTVPVPGQCPEAFEVRRVGDYLDDGVGRTMWAPGAQSGCRDVGVSDASYIAVHALEGVEDLDRYQAGVIESVSVAGSRIEARYVRGDDGSFVRLGQRDTQLDTPCAPESDPEGDVRCTPDTNTARIPYQFVDDACKTHAALREVACDDGSPFVFAFREVEDGCASRRFYARGEVATQSFLMGESGSCVRAEGVTGVVYRAGDAIEAKRFVALTPDRSGDERVVRERYRDEAGQLVYGPEALARWFDRELGFSCTFDVTEAGTRRCLPSQYGELLFRDAACEEPVMRKLGCGDVTHMTAADLEAGGASCPVVYRAYELGAEVTVDTPYLRMADGSCVALPSTPGTFHRVTPIETRRLAAWVERAD